MKHFTKTLLAVAIIIQMSACSPMSKESYMKQFDAFVTEIAGNYKNYSEQDWREMSEKYDKFSGEWYNKFEKEFTLKDEIAIKANQAKWYYYSNLNAATSVFKQLFESLDLQGIKKQVQYYIDNNMQKDLQKFYDEAKKAGKDAEEAVTEILKKLNVQIKELQK